MSELDRGKKTTRFIAFNLFILFFSIYLLTATGLSYYFTDTSVMRLQIAQSIIERLDTSVPDGVRGADGRYYSWFGIGSALLAIPFYIIGKLIGVPAVAVSLMNQLFGAATVALIFLFSVSLGYSKRASLLVAFFYGLGTMAWPLAKHPFDHTIETFFILLSVYFLYLFCMRKRNYFLILSAFSIGFAFITRTTSILIIPPLFVIIFIFYYSKRYSLKVTAKFIAKDIILFLLAFSPFLALSLWYNYYRFGSILETGYQIMAARAGISMFRGTSFLEGLAGLLISPGKGFFYYSPVAILFIFSIKAFMKKHYVLGIPFVLIILSYLFFHSKYWWWHGDWAWGPRFIFVITTFLIIMQAEIFDSSIWRKRSFLRIAVYTILTVSLIVQIAAVSVDFKKYFLNLQIEEKVKFDGAYLEGGIPFFKPPAETYFNWHRSPILAQFKFIYEITKEIRNYRYLELPHNARKSEKIMASPYMNVYDFWWLYNYYTDRSYAGLFAALVLLLLAIYTAMRLWRAMTDNFY